MRLEELKALLPVQNADQMEDTSVECFYKVVLVGDRINAREQGKSHILKVFSNRKPFTTRPPTSMVGIDFDIIPLVLNNVCFRLQILDTAGQESSLAFTKKSFRNAKIAFIVCDLSEPASFDSIIRWKEQIKTANDSPVTTVLLFTNANAYGQDIKSDAELNQFVRKNGILTWYKVDTQDELGKQMLNKALEHAVKNCYLSSNPRSMHSLLLGNNQTMTHAFAHHGGAAILFLKVFLSEKTGFLGLDKNIWIIIFTHFFKNGLNRNTCENIAVDLTKSRFAFCFFSRFHQAPDQVHKLIDEVQQASNVSDLRDKIKSAQPLLKDSCRFNETLAAWKFLIDESKIDADAKKENACALM